MKVTVLPRFSGKKRWLGMKRDIERQTPAMLTILFACLAGLTVSVAQAGPPLDFERDAFPWDRLVYYPAGRHDDMRVEVKLSEVDPDQLPALIDTRPDEQAASADGASAFRMTSTVAVFLTGRTYETDILFLDRGMSPLQRRRDKIGNDPSRKTYRYLTDGVRRVRLEPSGNAEAELPPESWSQVKEQFYPYGQARRECPALSDPNLLLIIASAAAMMTVEEPVALCIFNKKSIHPLKLWMGSGEAVEVDYLETRDGTQTRVRGEVKVRRGRIEALGDDASRTDDEPFEFFEMGGEIEIDLDVKSGLPLRISGDIQGFGRAEFLLGEVAWRP